MSNKEIITDISYINIIGYQWKIFKSNILMWCSTCKELNIKNVLNEKRENTIKRAREKTKNATKK